jgi:hypothetical protein
VNPASTGGDGTTNATSGANAAYSSLNACLTAEFAASPDLTSADLVLEIHRQGTGNDATACNFSSYQFTTDSTRYVWIVVDSDRHAGVWSTSKARMSLSNSPGVIYNVNCTLVVEGLQIENTVGLTGNPTGVGLTNNGTGHVTVRECLLRASSTSGTATQGSAVGGSGTSARQLTVANCLIYGKFFNGIELRFLPAGGKLVAYYNTILGVQNNGIYASSNATSTTYLKNNRVDSPVAGSCFSYASTTLAGSAGNYSSDATCPQAGNLSKTFAYLNAAGSDYHLASGDTFTGSDLSADAQFAVSTDVDGDTRSSFYAGFDELTAAATDNDPTQTTATVPNVTVGNLRTITVEARKSDGSDMTVGGATVVVTITGTNASSPTVTDNGDGTYTASDTPASVGSDSVAITLGGTAISGSPYSSTVSAAPTSSPYYFMRRRRR